MLKTTAHTKQNYASAVHFAYRRRFTRELEGEMNTRRSALPVAAVALAKALAQLQIARSAASVSDENLAAEIAEAEALLERLRARILGAERGAPSAKYYRDQTERQSGVGGSVETN